jgi:hypothetical protein
MCPLVEVAAVSAPADAKALSERPIAMAHHVLSPQLVIVDLHLEAGQKAEGQKAALQAAGGSPSLSAVWCHLLTPHSSSVARETAAKAIWQRRKKHSMHEQYACVLLNRFPLFQGSGRGRCR